MKYLGDGGQNLKNENFLLFVLFQNCFPQISQKISYIPKPFNPNFPSNFCKNLETKTSSSRKIPFLYFFQVRYSWSKFLHFTYCDELL